MKTILEVMHSLCRRRVCLLLVSPVELRLCTGVVDEARLAVVGGSHGGFLAGNLVGQHPGRFRCGVLRNPVMDLGLMVHVSDIPDWVFIEAWGPQARRCWLCGCAPVVMSPDVVGACVNHTAGSSAGASAFSCLRSSCSGRLACLMSRGVGGR